MNYLLVFIGGGLGSISRFGISQLFGATALAFPLPTLISNFLACLIMGIGIFLLKIKTGSDWSLFLFTGFCGGFSTFSTFSMETVQLIDSQQYSYAALNVLISFLSCLFVLYILFKIR